MKTSRFLAALLFVLASLRVAADEPAQVRETKGPIVGEKLTYHLRWGMIPVGWCTMHVCDIKEYKGRPVYHIVMKAWSNSFLSKFYRIRDYAETYVDVDGLYSWRFYKKQEEGRYRSDEEMVYDHAKRKGVYRSFRNGSVKEVEIPSGVQDTLSSIYLFRTMPLKVGESVMMDVNADEKNWKLEIQVLKFRKRMEIRRLGIFDAFYVEPMAQFNGLLERRGRVWVWISADRRRLPLVVKSKVPFGSVTASLVKAEVVKTGPLSRSLAQSPASPEKPASSIVLKHRPPPRDAPSQTLRTSEDTRAAENYA